MKTIALLLILCCCSPKYQAQKAPVNEVQQRHNENKFKTTLTCLMFIGLICHMVNEDSSKWK